MLPPVVEHDLPQTGAGVTNQPSDIISLVVVRASPRRKLSKKRPPANELASGSPSVYSNNRHSSVASRLEEHTSGGATAPRTQRKLSKKRKQNSSSGANTDSMGAAPRPKQEFSILMCETQIDPSSVLLDQPESVTLARDTTKRWTLAMTENIPDHILAEELEKLRLARFSPGRTSEGVEELEANDWLTGSHTTLFVCRELLRTERSYLARLESMASCNVGFMPRPLFKLLPPLVQLAQKLICEWQLDGSPTALAKVFLDNEREIEEAFTAWCAVVGLVFECQPSMGLPTRKLVRGASVRTSWKQDAEGVNHKRPLSLISTDSDSHFVAGSSLLQKRRTFSLRELAVEPTQRVTRYVLLLKGFLRNNSWNYMMLNIR
jgi:hypothetical protein